MFRVRTQGFFELCEARTMIRTSNITFIGGFEADSNPSLGFQFAFNLGFGVHQERTIFRRLPEESPIHDDVIGVNSVTVPETNS